jgi:ketosteroid isomerase-like protein
MTNSTQLQILDLGQRWAAAERDEDVAALDTLLHPEFVGVGPRGFVLTRGQWLERYRSGDLRNQAFAWEDVQVRDFGDTALAVGVWDQQTTYKGQDVSGRFRATQVAVRRDGRWLIAGVHLSGPLVEPPAR